MSDLITILGVIGAAAVGFIGLLFKWKSDGRKEAFREAKEADYEAAADLRDTVDRNLDDRVRKMDGRGYRD